MLIGTMYANVPFPGILEPDPKLYHRLKANSSSPERTVLGRRLKMEVDAFGCRTVVGQPPTAKTTLAVYGCSFTYGHAIATEETFCSLLQQLLPNWRVENHGVPGYGTAQNLLQLCRNSRWDFADYVTFGWIPHHLLRNVGDLSWLKNLTAGIDTNTPDRCFRFPKAGLSADAHLEFRYIELPRRDLDLLDLSDFRPEWYYLDLVCIALFKRAAEIVNGNGGHFFVTVLTEGLSERLRSHLQQADIPIVDAGLNGVTFTSLPDDHHPNALANQIYADKIHQYLLGQDKVSGLGVIFPKETASASDLVAESFGSFSLVWPSAASSLTHSRWAGALPEPSDRDDIQSILEPDPVLHKRLKLNSTAEVTLQGRQVVMSVDSSGCRPVLDQPPFGEKILALYGCCFTYGYAVALDETFCSLLQGMLPAWRIENHGVPFYSGAQNLLDLRRNARWNAHDYVTFCWMPHHLLRNVASPAWLIWLTQHLVTQNSMFPSGGLDQNGEFLFRTLDLPRPELIDLDLSDFHLDEFYLDLVCFAVFHSASKIVKASGGQFFVTTSMGSLSSQLKRRLDAAQIPVVDTGLKGAELASLFGDYHSNAEAHRIHARKIHEFLLGCSTSPALQQKGRQR